MPASAQFLNVIESVFSSMARAIIHNSDYPSADAAMAEIDRHFAERNRHYQDNPKRAGKELLGKERTTSRYSADNNCKGPAYRWQAHGAVGLRPGRSDLLAKTLSSGRNATKEPTPGALLN